ncbi:Thioredoxin [Candidatus Norongarragalina meridionalis]|nr:Thioredoxin [Candidatus Norongarragalina meridionalis]
MVFCLFAVAIFAVLGLFSAKYRAYASEAWSCAFKTMTLRKCDTGFDEKMKSKIVAKILPYSAATARFVHEQFVAISWILVASTLVSGIMVAQAAYNTYAYGNCNGPDATEACIFNPAGTGFSACGVSTTGKSLNYPPSLEGHSLGTKTGLAVVEFGCFTCPYTKKTEPVVKQMLAEYGDRIYFVFKSFPASHQHDWDSAEAAECAAEQNRYWDYHDAIFAGQTEVRANGTAALQEIAQNLGLNTAQFSQCMSSHKYLAVVNESYTEGLISKIYGTPTFFIGNETFVGYKDYGVLKDAIERELKK